MTVKNETKSKIYINTLENGERLSTQALLQIINKKIEEGFTDFEINACGQHDIGGPVWSKNNDKLFFHIKNPGQRVGSMGMKNTKIVVEGSSPADIGWLNSGATIVVKGDGGDTTAHCASGGKIFVKGKVGTRSGALMKHDPKFEPPQFWVLKNTGSFSFEFMGGGIAVVCGLGCESLDSVLGKRPCVGMVGGVVYLRGNVIDIPENVWLKPVDEEDIDFLSKGMKEFLEETDSIEHLKELCDFSKWRKIVAKPFEMRKDKEKPMTIKEFRQKHWVEGGIFGDFYDDDFEVEPFVTKGENRLKIPYWNNRKQSAPCEFACPVGIPTQERISLLHKGKVKEAVELVFDYSPFPASVCGDVCPQLCMDSCSRQYVDEHIKMTELSLMSKDVKLEKVPVSKKEKISIIGSGVSGLTCAWHLSRNGYQVEVFDENEQLGGKLTSVIPEQRLKRENLNADLNRLRETSIKFNLGKKINREDFEKIEQESDAVLVATGAHVPKVINVEGKERLVFGLDFLKDINNGCKIDLKGQKIVVIGAGNASMDVIIGAYKMGAKEVTAIDVQKPLAFEKEINHAKSLGAKILYPCFTKEISENGVVLDDGTILEAQRVIISIGDRPDLSFLDDSLKDEKGSVIKNSFNQSEVNKKIFFSGDVLKQGLFTDAIADGLLASKNIINSFENKPLLEKNQKQPEVCHSSLNYECYNAFSSSKVFEMKGFEEDQRCLSCGLCRDCEFCLQACPQNAIEKFQDQTGKTIYVSNEQRCIGCGICAGVCPCGIWQMEENPRQFI